MVPAAFPLLCALSLVFVALTFPVYFRFDNVKAQWVRLTLIVLVAGLVGGGIALSEGMVESMNMAEWMEAMPVAPIAAVSAVLTAVSVPLSIRAYRKRRG